MIRKRNIYDSRKKKNSRRKQARFRSSRRKRIRNTVLLLLLLVVLGGTGIGAIYVLRNGTVFDKLEDAYVASREFSGGITDLDSLRADGFAKNLCVVVSDVPMDGVSLGKTRKDFFWIWMTERCFIPNRHFKRYTRQVSPRS